MQASMETHFGHPGYRGAGVLVAIETPTTAAARPTFLHFCSWLCHAIRVSGANKLLCWVFFSVFARPTKLHGMTSASIKARLFTDQLEKLTVPVIDSNVQAFFQ